MKTIRTVAELRAELAPLRRTERTIGLVPTMGALHEGHLSLMRRALEVCDVVVVSLFVNPAQFTEAADLDIYPRDEARDASLVDELGVDYLFAPPVSEVYPPGFATTVSVTGVSAGLEGEHRGPGHFDGVATVVAKLLNMVSPDVAYFGQKDAQQTVVIRRLVRDLDIPVRIEICPTIRGADGLALSSRNALLSDDERRRATALHRALSAVRAAVDDGAQDPASALAQGHSVLERAGVAVEYLSLVDPETMEPLRELHGDALAVIAARVGSTRLIDNTLITDTRTIDNEVATRLRAPTA
ncbi:MAG TPA: pantoate--beta-alanine ligase [Solirubrobacteraceae bacterium]|jgi:pantoate--beta-alanine ligase|nr:pantoate--beta-alanine ligase [Solirubrobacteraceae bacterium]